MDDKSDLEAVEFIPKCLNLIPRGVFGKANSSGEANNTGRIESGEHTRLRSHRNFP